jgi:hypothetical protein
VPLGKNDNPTSRRSETISVTVTGGDAGAAAEPVSDKDERAATNAAIDAAAGAPAAQREAAEDLPEKDDVQKNIKKGLTADDAQTEAKAKAAVVDDSPNAAETPSGGALKAVAGISDDVERGEAYEREKSARRWGYVKAEDEDK